MSTTIRPGAPPVPAPRPPADEPVLVDTARDQSVRWRPGERLHHVFEDLAQRRADEIAVSTADADLTFAELDRRANRLARRLLAAGAGPGDRVALLLDEPVEAYTAMLAALKAHTAYVPLDAGFPADRIAYICGDAGVRLALAPGHLTRPCPATSRPSTRATTRPPRTARSPPRSPASPPTSSPT